MIQVIEEIERLIVEVLEICQFAYDGLRRSTQAQRLVAVRAGRRVESADVCTTRRTRAVASGGFRRRRRDDDRDAPEFSVAGSRCPRPMHRPIQRFSTEYLSA